MFEDFPKHLGPVQVGRSKYPLLLLCIEHVPHILLFSSSMSSKSMQPSASLITCTMQSLFFLFCSVEFKMVSVHSEKPICTSPRLSDASSSYIHYRCTHTHTHTIYSCDCVHVCLCKLQALVYDILPLEGGAESGARSVVCVCRHVLSPFVSVSGQQTKPEQLVNRAKSRLITKVGNIRLQEKGKLGFWMYDTNSTKGCNSYLVRYVWLE